MPIICGSGLLLWFPDFFTRFLPGWILNAAYVIHSDEALLATAFIFGLGQVPLAPGHPSQVGLGHGHLFGYPGRCPRFQGTRGIARYLFHLAALSAQDRQPGQRPAA